MSLVKLTKLDDIPRMILDLHGLNGTGKSHFALTSPQPIAWFATDPGLEGVINKFVDAGLDIQVGEYYFDQREGTPAEWLQLYEQLEKELYAAIHGDWARTIVIDRWDLFYDLLRLARHGKLIGISQFTYPAMYLELRAIVNAVQHKTEKNLLLLSTMDKKRHAETNSDGVTEQVWDGVSYMRKGWKDTAEVVQVSCEIDMDKEGRFITTYKCRQQDSLRAVNITSPSYRKLARLMFPKIPRGEFTKQFGPCLSLGEKILKEKKKRVK